MNISTHKWWELRNWLFWCHIFSVALITLATLNSISEQVLIIISRLISISLWVCLDRAIPSAGKSQSIFPSHDVWLVFPRVYPTHNIMRFISYFWSIQYKLIIFLADDNSITLGRNSGSRTAEMLRIYSLVGEILDLI